MEMTNQTAPVLSHDEWLSERQKGIGGSDISAIIGINPYRTAVDVYFDKIGQADPIPDNQHMKMGRILEPVIADLFAEETGNEVIVPAKQIYQHKEFPFFQASIDRFYHDNERNEKGVLEIKSTQKNMIDVDRTHFTQLQWYLGITEYDFGSVFYLEHGLNTPPPFEYERDDLYLEFLQEQAYSFWKNHVVKRVPPEPVNSEDIKKLFPQHIKDKAIEAKEETYKVFQELVEVKEKVKELSARKEEIEEAIKLVFRDAEAIEYNGITLATYKTQSQKRIDSKRLKAELPDIFEKYANVISFRKLLVK